jgi:hypothetical protein
VQLCEKGDFAAANELLESHSSLHALETYKQSMHEGKQLRARIAAAQLRHETLLPTADAEASLDMLRGLVLEAHSKPHDALLLLRIAQHYIDAGHYVGALRYTLQCLAQAQSLSMDATAGQAAAMLAEIQLQLGLQQSAAALANATLLLGPGARAAQIALARSLITSEPRAALEILASARAECERSKSAQLLEVVHLQSIAFNAIGDEAARNNAAREFMRVRAAQLSSASFGFDS